MAHCNTLSNTEQQKWKMFSWAQTGPVRCTHRKIISLKATNGYSYNNVECGCAPGTIWHIKLHCGTSQSCTKTQYFSINWFLCNSTLIMSQAFNYTSACYKNETMINNSGSERRVPPWSAVRCMKTGNIKRDIIGYSAMIHSWQGRWMWSGAGQINTDRGLGLLWRWAPIAYSWSGPGDTQDLWVAVDIAR